MKSVFSRRDWLKLSMGLSLGGLLGTAKAAQAQCENLTPQQEMGPFFPYHDIKDKDHDLTMIDGHSARAVGELIYVRGQITDQQCQPVAGAIITVWQANAAGRYRHEYDTSAAQADPNFQGWAMLKSDDNGHYGFKTIKPGAYGSRTPHIHFQVAKRGYHELVSQLYFEGEAKNATDGLFNLLSTSEQAKVTHPLLSHQPGIEADAKLVKFDLQIQTVLPGLSKTQQAQYIGQYDLQFKGSAFEQYVPQYFGEALDKIILNIIQHDGLLYANLSGRQQGEIVFQGNDLFSYSVFDSRLQFIRDAQNNIVEANLIPNQIKEQFKGPKIV